MSDYVDGLAGENSRLRDYLICSTKFHRNERGDCLQNHYDCDDGYLSDGTRSSLFHVSAPLN